ncbi:MAG: glutamyl-tRNA reductase [Chthoniobacterales bacterium]
MNLFCVGISHHTANVETRERYANPPVAEIDCAERLILATCNRVEFYGVASTHVATTDIVHWLANNDANETESFYRYENERCVQHLFRVVSGLDSMVVGETEIFGQAKKAYEQARASGSAGPSLHRLFQRAFRLAKEVRTRTEITRGAVSVGGVAVELAGKIFGDLRNVTVLLLGAGETSERTARALVSRGVRDLRVSNRSRERADSLTVAVGGRTVPFDQWLEHCTQADILISSTAADEPLLRREMLKPILAQRVDRPLFIIDIAVPRDVAPDVNELEGVYLYDMDSLQSLAEQSLALRRQQVVAGEEIIAEHVAEFTSRYISTAATPLPDSRLRPQES